VTDRPSYPFTVKSRDLLAIAIPASLAFITEPLAGINDITVIGRLGDAALLGGMVLGALAFDTLFSLAYFLRLGTAGLTAQAIGARDPDDGLMHAARAQFVAIIIGTLMILLAQPLLWLLTALFQPPTQGVSDALAAYFHVRIWSAPFSLLNYALLGWFYGRAAAKTGMLLQILVHGVDIVLSIWFVFGLGWGIFGAALGTVLGQAAAAIAGLYLFARHYGGVRAVLSKLDPQALFDFTGVKRMLSLSRDLMIRSIALMAAYAWFAAQGSRSGETILAANAILLNFLMLSGFFLDGLAQAAEQICGKAVGANYRPAFERAVSLAMRWGVGVGLALALLFQFGGPWLIDFMTTNDDVRQVARDFLIFAALSALTGMPPFVLDGILSGATLNHTMRNGMVVSFAIYLAAVLVLQPLWGNAGLWTAIHIFFFARAAYYWIALEPRKTQLFTA
jgi:MATE family multidrug resistance protein